MFRLDVGLHLHRFSDHQDIAGLDHITGLDQQFENLARHRCPDMRRVAFVSFFTEGITVFN